MKKPSKFDKFDQAMIEIAIFFVKLALKILVLFFMLFAFIAPTIVIADLIIYKEFNLLNFIEALGIGFIGIYIARAIPLVDQYGDKADEHINN